MATEVKVPSLGELVTEATVAKWLKRPGEPVAIDEPIAELETDKITLEVYAPAAGTLAEILADEGANVPVGAVLGRIAEGAAVAVTAPHPSPLPAPTLTLPRDAGEGREGASGEREGPAKREGEGQLALERSGPAVRKLIEESGLDTGTDRTERTRRPDHQGGCAIARAPGPPPTPSAPAA